MPELSELTQERVSAIRDALVRVIQNVDMEALRRDAATAAVAPEGTIICTSGCVAA